VDYSYFTYGKTSMIEKILNFAIKILIIGGVLGLAIGVDMMIELILLRTI
jgi:hypothetical protein